MKKPKKHVVSRMIVASSNIIRKGIHIVMTEEHRKFKPVYQNETRQRND